jgi:hypothetical protein
MSILKRSDSYLTIFREMKIIRADIMDRLVSILNLTKLYFITKGIVLQGILISYIAITIYFSIILYLAKLIKLTSLS